MFLISFRLTWKKTNKEAVGDVLIEKVYEKTVKWNMFYEIKSSCSGKLGIDG